MSTVREIRDFVRTQLDVDEDDLPDELLTPYVREAFERTFAFERRWPFFEETWTFSTSDPTFDMPDDPPVAFVSSLRNTDDNIRLEQVGQTEAEDYFEGVVAEAEPDMFSVWGSTVTLWPPATAETRNFSLRGYRKAVWEDDPDEEIDGDPLLHTPIKHYACALAYAQLEDPEMEAQYMIRWQQGVEQQRDLIMLPQFHEPLVLNGGIARRRRRPSITFQV